LLNNRPRKVLDYRTPQEVFNRGVALTSWMWDLMQLLWWVKEASIDKLLVTMPSVLINFSVIL